eukprot:gene10611-3129_t
MVLTQRLTSFTLKDAFKNRNSQGLLMVSGGLIGVLALFNEYFVHKLSNYGIAEKQKILKESLVPKQKPEYVIEWEKKYKK